MSKGSIGLGQELNRYLVEVACRESDLMKALRRETAELPQSSMQISPEQGQFMRLVVELLGARRILEIGTFTGYSSLAMACALPSGGHLVACDVSDEWTRVARRYWAEAGVEDRIELRLGPALSTLAGLLDESGESVFDLAFIDADKANYAAYYEYCLRLVRPGGLIMLDNVLWSGKVADPREQDADTLALRELNAKLAGDERVSIAMLPLADGLTLARVR